MKDIIFYLLIYKIWDTPFHAEHKFMITIVFPLWITFNFFELLDKIDNNNIMKDIIFYLLIYHIWNTPFHNEYETMIAVVLTLWIIMNFIELLDEFNKH